MFRVLGVSLAVASIVGIQGATVLIAGDSWGTEGSRSFNEVMKEHSPSTTVKNIAVGGTTAADWAGRDLSKLTTAAATADHLWLTVGGNDAIDYLPLCALEGKSIDECVAETVVKVVADLTTILEAVHAANPNIQVVGFGYDILGMDKDILCKVAAEGIMPQCTGSDFITCFNTQFVKIQSQGWDVLAEKYDYVHTLTILGTLQAEEDAAAAIGAPVLSEWSPKDLMELSCIHANNKGYKVIFEVMWEQYWSGVLSTAVEAIV